MKCLNGMVTTRIQAVDTREQAQTFSMAGVCAFDRYLCPNSCRSGVFFLFLESFKLSNENRPRTLPSAQAVGKGIEEMR